MIAVLEFGDRKTKCLNQQVPAEDTNEMIHKFSYDLLQCLQVMVRQVIMVLGTTWFHSTKINDKRLISFLHVKIIYVTL